MVNTKIQSLCFSRRYKTDLTNLGGIQQAEKELDKNVFEIKALVKNIGDLSKILFKQKRFFCTMKAIISTTHSI